MTKDIAHRKEFTMAGIRSESKNLINNLMSLVSIVILGSVYLSRLYFPISSHRISDPEHSAATSVRLTVPSATPTQRQHEIFLS